MYKHRDRERELEAGSAAPGRARGAPGVPGKATLVGATPTMALPPALRARLERALAADLSAVRVGEDPAVAEMGARAHADGTDVLFAPGAYQPDTADGQALIAHEVVHLVQQAEGRVAANAEVGGRAVNADRGLEGEADDLAARALRGERVRTSAAPALRAAGGPIQGKFPDGAEPSTGAESASSKPKGKITKDGFQYSREVSRGPVKLSGSITLKIPAKPDTEEYWAKVAEREGDIDLETGTVAQSLAVANLELLKLDLDGLTVKLDTKLLQGGIEVQRDGKFKLEMKALEIGLDVSGKHPVGGFDAVWSMSGSIAVGPEEAAKLYKALTEAKDLSKELKEAAKLKKEYEEVTGYVKHHRRVVKAGGPAAKRSAATLEKLGKRLEPIVTRLDELSKVVAQRVSILKVLGEGLRHKAGAIVSKIAAHAVAKAIGRWITRLAPGVGWALMVMDIVELGFEIERVLGLESVTWGDPDAAKHEGSGDTDGDGDGGGDGSTSGDGADTADEGGPPDGSGDAGVAVDGGEETGTEPLTESMPVPTDAARRVLAILPDGTRTAMTAADLATLNAMIPSDVTDAELLELITRLAGKGVPSDPITAIGRIRALLDAIRSGDQGSKLMIDGKDAPEVLAKARERLGLDPSGDEAIEGAGAGDAAKASDADTAPGHDEGGRGTTEEDELAPDDDGAATGPALDDDQVPPGVELTLRDPRRLFTFSDGKLVWKPGAREAATKIYTATDGLAFRVTDMELVDQQQEDGKPISAQLQVDYDVVRFDSVTSTYVQLGDARHKTFELQFQPDEREPETLVGAAELAACVTYDPSTGHWSAKADKSFRVGTATVAVTGVDESSLFPGYDETSGAYHDRFLLVLVPTEVGTPATTIQTSTGMQTLLIGVPVKVWIVVRRPDPADAG